MEVAEEVSAKRIAKKVGKTLKVLVDEINADGGIGRTAAHAPSTSHATPHSSRAVIVLIILSSASPNAAFSRSSRQSNISPFHLRAIGITFL